jgi:hypothetical protein
LRMSAMGCGRVSPHSTANVNIVWSDRITFRIASGQSGWCPTWLGSGRNQLPASCTSTPISATAPRTSGTDPAR